MVNECDHTRQDFVRVASVVEKMVKSRFKWIEHKWTRPIEKPARKLNKMEDNPIQQLKIKGGQRELFTKPLKKIYSSTICH